MARLFGDQVEELKQAAQIYAPFFAEWRKLREIQASVDYLW
jgi:hypothetical protein